MLDITFVITVKGRLVQLQQTLPQLQKQARVVVVDYDCPDKTGCWVEEHFPLVDVVYVAATGQFNNAKARNLGALHVKTKWVGFLDCDVLVSSDFNLLLRPLLIDDGRLIKAYVAARGLFGFMCMTMADFIFAGGYDECMDGYAPEDEQLCRKLSGVGAKIVRLPVECLFHLEHDEISRTRFYHEKEAHVSWRNNAAVMFPKIEKFIAEKQVQWKALHS